MKASLFLLLSLALPAAHAADSIWRPALNTSWQWQLTGKLDLSPDVELFDVDLYTTSAADVKAIHAKGARAVCYISAGTFEPWRPDAAAFPDVVKGRGLSGWPDERWLDIRRLDLLGPIMEARMDLCKSKGFDGIEPDNVDAYSNKSGFTLSAADQLKYNRFLAAAAHARGLSVGLKNDVDQVRDLVADFDWAINEECFEYQECNALSPFIAAGKAVFHVEYNLPTNAFCPRANELNFNSLKKGLDLDAPREACRPRLTPAFEPVVNAASLSAGGVAPGEIVIIAGAGFGPAELVKPAWMITAPELAGVSVTFDEFVAPLLSLSSTQVTAIAPPAIAGREKTTVRVLRKDAELATYTLAVRLAHAGLYTLDSSGKGQLVAIHEDWTLNVPSNPARRGSVVALWGTGFGKGALSVTIGGQEAEIVSTSATGMGIPGLYHISVRIPAAAPEGERIEVTAGNAEGASQPGVSIAVAP